MLNILDNFLSMKLMSETSALVLSAQFLIDQLSKTTDLSHCFHLPSYCLYLGLYPQEVFRSNDMAPAKLIGLANYWIILVAHDQEYGNFKGADCQEIVAGIMQ
jgi:hypothetical protein